VIPNAVEAPVEIFMDTLNVQLKSDTVITINTNSLQIDTTQKVEPKPTKNIGKANSKPTKSAKKPKDSMVLLFEEKPKKSLRKK
jgi:hypothetical protein